MSACLPLKPKTRPGRGGVGARLQQLLLRLQNLGRGPLLAPNITFIVALFSRFDAKVCRFPVLTVKVSPRQLGCSH